MFKFKARSGLLVALLSGILLLGLSLLRPLIEGFEDGAWRGYQQVLVSRNAELDDVVGLLTQRGYEVVSRSNQIVRVYDYTGWRQLPLSEIESSLHPLDPRLDPYIAGLPDYFSGYSPSTDTEWEIIYIKNLPIGYYLNWELYRLLSALGVEYSIPAKVVVQSPTAMLAIGVFFALLLLMHGRRWWSVAPLLLPWGVGSLGNSVELATANLTIALLLTIYFRANGESTANDAIHPAIPSISGSFSKKGDQLQVLAVSGVPRRFGAIRSLLESSPRHLVLPPIVAIVVLILLYWGWSALLGSIAGIGAHISIVTGLNGLHRWRECAREHPLFRHLALVDRVALPPRYLSSMALCCLVLIVLAVLPRFSRWEQWQLPIPVGREGGISLSALEKGWDEKKEKSLPNLSDFFAHSAYQSGFPLGWAYQFPKPGDALTRQEFYLDGPHLSEREHTVLEFTNGWYIDIIDAESVVGIPAILLSQGSVVDVQLRSLGYRSGLTGISLAIVVFSTLACVGVQLLGRRYSPSLKQNSRSALLLFGGGS